MGTKKPAKRSAAKKTAGKSGAAPLKSAKELVIVTGISGAGKASALKSFEAQRSIACLKSSRA